jgi:hypothetical protein
MTNLEQAWGVEQSWRRRVMFGGGREMRAGVVKALLKKGSPKSTAEAPAPTPPERVQLRGRLPEEPVQFMGVLRGTFHTPPDRHSKAG